MINTVIVTGGEETEEYFKNIFYNNKFQNIIAVDKGLEILDKCNIEPNYIIGDFDSINKNIFLKYCNKDIEIIKLNPEKDYTDTHMAIKLAIDLKSTDIIIIGAIGTRIDHVLGNINILKECMDNGIDAKIVNFNNEIKLINKNTTIKKDENYKYISIIPLTSKVEDVTLKGFKYELNKYTLEIGNSLGISNEQILEEASIELKNGILIIIKSKD